MAVLKANGKILVRGGSGGNYLQGIETKSATTDGQTITIKNNYRTIIQTSLTTIVNVNIIVNASSLVFAELILYGNVKVSSIKDSNGNDLFFGGVVESYIDGLRFVYSIRDYGIVYGAPYGEYGPDLIISGVSHKTCYIGSKIWQAEYMKVPFGVVGTDCQLGSPSPYDFYYYKQSSMMSSSGITPDFYSFVNAIGNGWRVPNESDIDELFSLIHGQEDVFYDLSVSNPPGKNTSHLSMLKSGSLSPSPSFSPTFRGDSGYIVGARTGGGLYSIRMRSKNSSELVDENTNDFFNTIRLVKDA